MIFDFIYCLVCVFFCGNFVIFLLSKLYRYWNLCCKVLSLNVYDDVKAKSCYVYAFIFFQLIFVVPNSPGAICYIYMKILLMQCIF